MTTALDCATARVSATMAEFREETVRGAVLAVLPSPDIAQRQESLKTTDSRAFVRLTREQADAVIDWIRDLQRENHLLRTLIYARQDEIIRAPGQPPAPKPERPATVTLIVRECQCGHSKSEHERDDGMRCYHRNKKRQLCCDCEGYRRAH